MSASNEDHPTKTSSIITKSWSLISSTMIGVTITILAILWQLNPTTPLEGMVVSTYMLMTALVLFVNATTVNEKIAYEQKKGTSPEVLEKWVHFAEYSFGLAFTLYISTFCILGYKYLLNLPIDPIFAVALPIVFLGVTWIILVIYTYLDSESGRKLPSKKRLLYIAIEAIALVFIIIDYIGLITIP